VRIALRLPLGVGLIGLLAALAGCSSTPSIPDVDVSNVPNAVPRVEPLSAKGNPSSYVVHGRRYYVLKTAAGYDEKGIASWYGPKFQGRLTSSGERYNMYAMTAAHRTLPIPSYVRVTNLRNGRSVIVRVNDRGPFVANRIIDLSYAAAKKLDIVREGTGLVDISAIDPRNPSRPAPSTSPRLAHAENPQIYIQLGAFSSRQNAEGLQARMQRYRIGPVVIQPGNSNHGWVYRVRLGPLASVGVADQAANRLENVGVQNFRIVIED
jgi:rare lipoprotein A